MKHIKPISSPMRHRLLLAMCMAGTLCVLSACNTTKPTPQSTVPQRPSSGQCQDDISPANNVALSGIQHALAQNKFHAALAQLDALNLQVPQAQLLKADAWRRVGQTEDARRLYNALLSSCLSGQAHHGLGLLLAGTQEHTESLAQLQLARALMPTDAQIRNDLGYAFLLRRKLPEARFEFMTAIELAPDFQRPKHNLFMLTALQNEDGVLKALARQWGMDAGTQASLQDRARQLPRIASTEPVKAGASQP
jgi:Flp pilus assembly protein TadD